MSVWVRHERIGACDLYLGDCLSIMPTLGKVDAVDTLDAVVYTEKYEKTAKWQCCSPEESGRNLGAEEGADNVPLRQRGHVSGGNGGDVRRIAAGLSEGDFAHGDTVEGAWPRGAFERAIYRRDAIDSLSADDRQGQMQPLRGDGSISDPPPGPQPHKQHLGQSRSALQSVPFQPPQSRMVALPEGWAILTDPPYGIGADAGVGKYGRLKAGPQRWDKSAPDVAWVADYPAIVWGGNYFNLPPSRAYLVWDKGAGFKGRDFAECEMAWCSFDANARIYARDPLARGDYRGKQHPTQKPVALMEWCLGFLPDAETILDPFMGSGTTLVACAKLGRKGIGIELDPDYFDIAVERVRKAYEQPDLFIPSPKPAVQEGFDL